MSSISSADLWPHSRMYSSRVILPEATSSRSSVGFMHSMMPKEPVQRRFAMSSPAISVIFLRRLKRGTSDVPLSARIEARPSFNLGCRTSSQNAMSSWFVFICFICAMSSSEILWRFATISCFCFFVSFDFSLGKKRFQRFFWKAFLSKGDTGISQPSGMPPTKSFTVS